MGMSGFLQESAIGFDWWISLEGPSVEEQDAKSRAKHRCPPSLKKLVDYVNWADANSLDGTLQKLVKQMKDARVSESHIRALKKQWASIVGSIRSLCRGVHELAQVAALPPTMREKYAKAVVGTDEEWERFCSCLPARLWRDPNPGGNLIVQGKYREWNRAVALGPRIEWNWPQVAIELVIGDDGRVASPDYNGMAALIGIEAKRLKECRRCQKIFWATRTDMVACSKTCAGALRAKTFRENKRLAEREAKRRKRP
jgi:hypothetical protein